MSPQVTFLSSNEVLFVYRTIEDPLLIVRIQARVLSGFNNFSEPIDMPPMNSVLSVRMIMNSVFRVPSIILTLNPPGIVYTCFDRDTNTFCAINSIPVNATELVDAKIVADSDGKETVAVQWNYSPTVTLYERNQSSSNLTPGPTVTLPPNVTNFDLNVISLNEVTLSYHLGGGAVNVLRSSDSFILNTTILYKNLRGLPEFNLSTFVSDSDGFLYHLATTSLNGLKVNLEGYASDKCFGYTDLMDFPVPFLCNCRLPYAVLGNQISLTPQLCYKNMWMFVGPFGTTLLRQTLPFRVLQYFENILQP